MNYYRVLDDVLDEKFIRTTLEHCPEYHKNNLAIFEDILKNPTLYGVLRKIAFMFNYGSWNYGLETENSDLDIICVVMSTAADLLDIKEIKCKEHQYPNGIVKEVDFRIFVNKIKKGKDINLMEIFNSRYAYISDDAKAIVPEFYKSFFDYQKMNNVYCCNALPLSYAYIGMAENLLDKYFASSCVKSLTNACVMSNKTYSLLKFKGLEDITGTVKETKLHTLISINKGELSSDELDEILYQSIKNLKILRAMSCYLTDLRIPTNKEDLDDFMWVCEELFKGLFVRGVESDLYIY